MIGKYPITKVSVLPSSFANQGYQIWYWFVGGSAFNCPLEPLTPEFWQKERNAILVYGVLLPGMQARDHGDVLILVTQNLNRAKKNRKFGDLTTFQRQALFALIVEIDFLQVTGFRKMPFSMRMQIFNSYEEAFRKQILPRKDEKGRYYRGFNDIKAFGILRPDSQGRIKCPRCGQLVAKGDGLLILNSFPLDNGMSFVNAICQDCRRPIGVRVASVSK